MLNHKTLIKQRIFRAHKFIGIVISFFLYISIFFGIFAIFLPYIQVWEKPKLYFKAENITEIQYEKMLNPILNDANLSNSKLEIILPGFRNLPYLSISRPFMKPYIFNPKNYEKIQLENSNLANFLNEIHYAKPLGNIALSIYGLISVASIFIIIGGLAMIIFYNFGSNPKNKRAMYSKWHRVIFAWTFLPLFLFVLSSSVMGISFNGLSLMSYFASDYQTSSTGAIIGKVIFPKDEIIRKSNIKSKMLPINKLIKIAQKTNPQINYEKATLINWSDKTARIILEGYNPYKPFINGITNKPKVILNAENGSLIKNVKAEDKKTQILMFEAVYFFHLLFGVDIFSRIFVAFCMIFCAAGIIFSTLLYLKKSEIKTKNYYFLSKFSIFAATGCFLSTACLFFSQWLLPFGLEYRQIWQQGIFYNVNLAVLAYCFYENNAKKILKNTLFLSGILFILSVVVRLVKFGLNFSIPSIFYVDLALVFLGFLLIIFSKKVSNV